MPSKRKTLINHSKKETQQHTMTIHFAESRAASNVFEKVAYIFFRR